MGRLQLVPERSYTTTLREYAGGNESDDAIEYFLHKKIGEKTLFIQSPSLLLFQDKHESVADVANGLEGSVCVEFAGIEDAATPIVTRVSHRHLGIVDDKQVSVAMFYTALHSSSLAKKQWLRAKDGALLGELYPRIGISLDQPIEFLDSAEALPIVSRRPALKLVD
ncbi:MAG TPA: hypothetical protein PKD28_01960 [Candidatus Saccharibacteria bacterium]|nr:hypothetical protein [Candidatus Saccharibacteria bacterium]